MRNATLVFPPLSALAFLSASAWSVLTFLRGDYWKEPETCFGTPDLHIVPLPAQDEEQIRVHAVVPARNEVDVINSTLGSLVAQRFGGSFSITLVDDHSADGTAQAAGREKTLQPRGDRLEIITASALRAGWTGKLWALECGVRHVLATGSPPDYWLFTDADIRHEPGNLRRLVAWARGDRLDLASLMVRLSCDPANPWERVLIPAFVYFFMQLYPFAWSRRSDRSTAAAAGGCVLVRNAALERIGGLEAIRDRIIDDCSLAGAIKASGRIDLRLTNAAMSARPYLTLGTIWKMVSRSAFTQLGESYTLTALAVPAMCVLYLAPPAAVAAGILRKKPRLFGAGALAWACMAATYRPTVRLYGLTNRDAFSLPLAALLFTAMTVDSAIAHARKRGGAWKGRSYST